jgi:hypothetical protein
MRIAVKECAGCNSRIDRKELIRLIQENLSSEEVDFVPFTSSDYDVLIAISGCHVNCAVMNAQEFLPQGAEMIVVHEYIVDGLYTSCLEEMADIIASKIIKNKNVA